MTNNLQTLYCISISFVSLFLVGFPVSAFLFNPKNQELSETTWLVAPFVGLAVIILVLQNFSYLGLPLEKTYYLVWVLAFLFWGLTLKSFSIKVIIKSVPVIVLSAALLVYLFHSIGLIRTGAHDYVGRAWPDQLNYVFLSQFLMHFPLHHESLNPFIHQPSLLKGAYFAATDRVGEAIYQGFIACSTFVDAKTTFEPTILLSPFLIVLAIYLTAKRIFLKTNVALCVAAVSGLLPSLAMIHLENFYSQALATPLLLIWPFIIANMLDHPQWKKICLAALILAAVTSIYTEYYLVFIGLLVVSVFFPLKSAKHFLTRCIYMSSIVIVAILFNPEYFSVFMKIIHKSVSISVLDRIYPWVNSLSGLARLWLGDWVMQLSAASAEVVNVLTCFFVAIALIGLAYETYKQKNNFLFSLCCLTLLPFTIYFAGHHQYHYQYYKLLLSISPLFPLGIALAFQHLKKLRYFQYVILVPLVVFGYLCCGGATLSMVMNSTDINKSFMLERGGNFKLLSADTREIEKKLNNMSGKNILIYWNDEFFEGNFINGWLSYFSRNNYLWLANPIQGDHASPLNELTTADLPEHFLLIAPTSLENFILGKSITKNLQNNTYGIWEIAGKQWALFYYSGDFIKLENISNRPFFSNDNHVQFHLIAGKKGFLTLKLNAYTQTENPFIQLRVTTDKNFSKIFAIHIPREKIILTIPVNIGPNVIKIESINSSIDEPMLQLQNVVF